MAVAAAPDAPSLKRSMRLGDVVLFFVVACSNLQWVAFAAAAGASALPIWLLGCAAMFIPIAICVVYLSSHYPDEGGMYVWSKRAFGPFAGFMTGWTYWASNLPYFPALLYFTAGNALYIGGSSGGALATSAPYFVAVAVGGLALSLIVNVLGLDIGKWLNNAGALSRWTVTVLLIAIGAFAWWKFGPATRIDLSTMRPGTNLKDVMFWAVIAFAWTGPEGLSFMGGEVRNSRRTVPFGLMLAAPLVAAIYILGTLAILAALKPSDVNATSGVMQTIAYAAQRSGWTVLTPLAAILVTISCLGSVSVWLGAVSRIPFVAGIDHYLPAAFGRVHPRWGSPVVSLLCLAGISAVFIFFGQGGSTVKTAYQALVDSTLITTFIPFLFLFASAVKLYARPVDQGAFRVPGGRATIALCALVGFLTTVGGIVFAFFPPDDAPSKPLFVLRVAVLTTAMVGAGVIVYVTGRRRAARRRG